jgi:manganese/zinc/iron transport system substrate-binding protein
MGRVTPRTAVVSVVLAGLAACGPVQAGGVPDPQEIAGRKIKAVATIGQIADVVQNVAGDRVDLVGLMGPGIDPHLYRASEGDVVTLAEADIVFYNGLHLEAKMADPEHAELYDTNARAYLAELEELDRYVAEQARRVPEEQAVLITAHDAFNYFGKAYDFEVRGLQGISTATETGTADLSGLADFIVEREIPAIFVETSVPQRFIEALREAVASRGSQVSIGGSLFSDAMGDAGTPEGTYIGMVRHNIDTIVDGLTESRGGES